ncbi:MAG TPA: alpha/beta fold hydrolase [Magnetospirillum sp.]|nr:alpha/beta fold hydrolase [Magnetospirillum sp.]
MSRVARALKQWKDKYVGADMWSGPGGIDANAVTQGALPDVSFYMPGGPEAVLLIHGLTGTPTEMRYVGKSLAAAGFTVYGMQLAGHCGTEADLLMTNWRDWYASVEAAYDRLAANHTTIFAAGLSMGAVMSMHLAANRPVAGIALYSTTLWYDGWTIPKLANLLPLFLYTPLGKRYRFVETFPYGIKDERLRRVVVAGMMSGDSASAGNLGMAGQSLRELRALIRVVKHEMPSVTTPTLILHAQDDDVTSVRNANYVEGRLGGPVRKVLLDDCYHMITVDRQRSRVVEESVRFFREIAGRPQLETAAE